MEEGETAGNETTTKNGETNGTNTIKRVPLSLEEMLERNKKEQEAVAKVIKKDILSTQNIYPFFCI